MKKYVFILFILFFTLMPILNASSKYIKVGCESCNEKCYILSGKYEIYSKKAISYNSITIPNGYNVYDGNKKITATKLYYENNSNLLFGCKDAEKSSNESIKDINFELSDELTCEEISGNNGILLVKIFIICIRILGPILMIVLSSYDFMMCIPNKDPDEMFKAWKRLELRAVVLILIMLLPAILNLIAKLFNIFDNCSIW